MRQQALQNADTSVTAHIIGTTRNVQAHVIHLPAQVLQIHQKSVSLIHGMITVVNATTDISGMKQSASFQYRSATSVLDKISAITTQKK